jgi:hypothetical protein
LAAPPTKSRRRPARKPVATSTPVVEAPLEPTVEPTVAPTVAPTIEPELLIVAAIPFEPVVPVEPAAPVLAEGTAVAEPPAKPRRRRAAKPKAVAVAPVEPAPAAPEPASAVVVEQLNTRLNGDAESAALTAEPPRTGVEILSVEDREGVLTYIVRDLRNNNIVRNVTRFSARHLWKYAITEREDNPLVEDQICWLGHLGLWKTYTRAGAKRFNLVQRDSAGNLHVYYGVTEDGIHGEWRGFLEGE